ncbi:hypothetical protein WQ54_15725 [Bacillus sp. SA1-12]|uniref:hypothetical protein n=1 Tax=Bacillus sp. SA1-12 TaxID=1455638 RepID=UPI0006272038|nr:hypothetical protein [Bacillus sp. SA1-12]KKI91271.1 hypothetical protein WQ54_15725 [Bacillus sp. SA1-12]
MEEEMRIYVNVDGTGNVVEGLGGTNPRPDKEYAFFFIRDKLILDNILKFKVVINGFKPDLILKDGERIEEVIDSPKPTELSS